MATKPKDAAPKRGRPRKPDGRRNNRGTPGHRGGTGRKEWEPRVDPSFTDPVTRVIRKQTKEEAWEEARALVRHMAAIGYAPEIMGRFLNPQIKDEATIRKHFAWELENGRFRADMQVAGVAFRMATSGRHESSTWRWLERRVEGFQPKQDVNFNGPIQVEMIPGDEGL